MERVMMTIFMILGWQMDDTIVRYGSSHTDAYNWDSTILVIERAGLVDLFDGKDPACPEITFFGLTIFLIIIYVRRPWITMISHV
ncbi:MAG: hypothetical protein ACLUDU_00780 [Butyricimonas faecihominis]